MRVTRVIRVIRVVRFIQPSFSIFLQCEHVGEVLLGEGSRERKELVVFSIRVVAVVGFVVFRVVLVDFRVTVCQGCSVCVCERERE